MNITVNSTTLQSVINDAKSNKDLIEFLNSVIDEELEKVNPDCDLIDECIDIIDELQQHKYTSPVLALVVSPNTIRKIVSPKRDSWKQLNRAVRVAIIAAVIATGTFTVNAAVKSVTGVDLIGNIASAVSSIIHPQSNKGELTTEVFVPAKEQTAAPAESETTALAKAQPSAIATTVTVNDKPKDTTTEPISNYDSVKSDLTTKHKREVNTTQIKEEPTDPYAKTDAPQLVGIRAEFNHFKTAYIFGEVLSYDGLDIFAVYSDKSEKAVPLSDCAYSNNLDMNVTADYNLTVTYKACTVNVPITVRPDEDTRLSDILSNSEWDYLACDKGVYLTAYKGEGTDITVNETDGKSVYAVSAKAFANGNVTSFSSDTVKTVLDGAFENSKIKTCNLPNVESIGKNAFKDSALQKVTLGDKLGKIGSSAFENTKITALTLPSAISSIPQKLCNNCTSLKTVTLLGKVETVGDMAFNNCTALTKLNGARYIKNVGTLAFAEDELMRFDSAPSVETVGDSGFANCKKANFGNIGANFKSLGAYAFDGCTGIKSIEIPGDVQTVPAFCFNATGATSLTLQNGVKRIEQGAFKGLDSQTVVIPSSIQYIGEYAFYSTALRTVTIKSKTAEICDNAFYLSRRVTFEVIENSTAHDFAVNNELNFNLIGED